ENADVVFQLTYNLATWLPAQTHATSYLVEPSSSLTTTLYDIFLSSPDIFFALTKPLFNEGQEGFVTLKNPVTGLRALPPKDRPTTLRDIVEKYIGSPYREFFRTSVPLAIPDQNRFEHMWIVSPQGGGKTQTYQAMILDDIERVLKDECSVVVID